MLLNQLMRRAFAAGSLGTALVLGAGLALAPVAPTHAAEEAKTTVRPEIGKPIQAAQDLLKGKKAKDALAKAREADAVPNKSAYETYVVQLVIGQAAAQAGEPAAAGAALEAAAAAATTGKAQLYAAAIGQHYSAKAYAKAVDLYDKYKADGGNDPALHTLYVQALYLGGNPTQAAKILRADVEAAEKSGQTVPETALQMLADLANKQKDNAGYQAAMEKLVANYPKKDYWLALIYAVQTRPGLSDRLALNLLRVKRATNTMRSTEEYVDAAQLALQAGFPVEAKRFIDEGYDAKLLGQGAEAERHKRLRDSADKALAADTKALGQDDAKLASLPNGEGLASTGFNYVLRGLNDKGLDLMEQAMQKEFKRPEEAKLNYGVALVLGGQKAKAIRVLNSVGGKDGAADIARLWILLANK